MAQQMAGSGPDPIRAATAQQQVETLPADQEVVAATAEHDVVAAPAEHGVIAATSATLPGFNTSGVRPWKRSRGSVRKGTVS